MYQLIHAAYISACICTLLVLSPLSGASRSDSYPANGTAAGGAVNAQTVDPWNPDVHMEIQIGAASMAGNGQPDGLQRDGIIFHLPAGSVSPKVTPVYLAQFFLGTSATAKLKDEICTDCRHARNSAAMVPEPVSMALVGIGLVSIYWLGRRRPKKSIEPRG